MCTEFVPVVDVIIVTYNSVRDIERCLSSVLAYNNRYRYRITIVDNASSDGTPELIITRYPGISLFSSKTNLGFARRNNQAIGQTQGKYVIFLNPDTEVKKGALDALIEFLDGNPDVGAVGPKLLNPDGSIQLTGNTFPSLRNLLIETLFLDRLFPRSRFLGEHKLSWWGRKAPAPVDWVMGACLALPRDVGDQVGWFDENFFMYFEETDLCRRIRDAGHQVYYIPTAEVIHYGGNGIKAYSGLKVIFWHQSLFYYFKKYHLERLFYLRLVILIRSFLRSSLWLLLIFRFGRFAFEKAWGYVKIFRFVFAGGRQ